MAMSDSNLEQSLKNGQRQQETEWSQYYSEDIEFAFLGRRREAISSLIPPSSGLALDIGCGPGVYAYDLTLKGYNVVSLDISTSYIKEAIDFSRRMGIWGRVDHLTGHGEWLPFKSNTFDLILISEVLEHLTQPLACIREMKRVSKANGVFVISVPSALSLTENILRLIGFKGHLWHFTPSHILGALRENSMAIVSTSSCNFFIWYVRKLPFAQKVYSIWLKLDKFLGKIPLVKYFGWCFIIRATKIDKKRD